MAHPYKKATAPKHKPQHPDHKPQTPDHKITRKHRPNKGRKVGRHG